MLLLLAISACRAAQKPPEPSPFVVDGNVVIVAEPAAGAAAVQVAQVGTAATDRLAVTGRLVWSEDATVRIFPPVSGRVTRIAADVGHAVKNGDVLAMLASPDFGQAQADAVRAAADERSAERSLNREAQLFERGATARKDLEQAEADRDRARAEEQRTRRRLALWGGERSKLGTVDQDFSLVAPISGLVVERNLNPGQEVRADTTTPLFIVSDPRQLWVLLDVTEQDFSDVAPRAALYIRSAANPGRTFDGVLDTLAPALDPTTRTLRARGKVDNPEGLLKAEMYVSVELEKRTGNRQPMLPARAVIREGDKQFVFVEERAGRYRRVEVSVGPEREGVVRVNRGVTNADRVVTEGSLLLESTWSEKQS
jgi:cobalt-zinc-cadmium efflux system membrane fusion protein